MNRDKGQRNLVWHPSDVLQEDRAGLLHQRGCVLWCTGLSGSGKSTVARELEKRLMDTGHLAFVLDGDNIRHGLNRDLGFGVQDRNENIRRIAEVAALFAECGVICITSFISPIRALREQACEIIGRGRFTEIFVDAPLEICEQRDPKEMYVRARRGEIPEFTGITSPYEAPAHPDVHVRTDRVTVDEAVESIFNHLVKSGFLGEHGGER
jgi:adenylylsulfate kinase